MNVQLDYDVWISFFDVIMVFLMIWGAYRGFSQGAIVQSISLFAVLGGLTICVNISKQVFRFLSPRSDVPDLFSVVLMALLFVGALYVSSYITGKVYNNVVSAPKGTTNRALGAFFGAAKYFFIASVYLLTLFKIEEHAKFLPEREKSSRMSRACIWTVTRIFPYLRMEKKQYRPFDYPSNNESKGVDEDENR